MNYSIPAVVLVVASASAGGLTGVVADSAAAGAAGRGGAGRLTGGERG